MNTARNAVSQLILDLFNQQTLKTSVFSDNNHKKYKFQVKVHKMSCIMSNGTIKYILYYRIVLKTK